MRWLAVGLLLGACGDADGPSVVDQGVPAEFCEGETRWRYDPLGVGGLTAIPDTVHTVADDGSETGRRVALDPVHDAWLAGLEPAVAAVYETLEGGLDLVFRVDAADSTLGVLQLVEMTLDPELDGRDYIYDIWLLVSDPSLATYTAEVSVDIVDSNGLELTIERSVVLSGGSL